MAALQLKVDDYLSGCWKPQVRVMVRNYAGQYFVAMAIHSVMHQMVEWWCPVCHEAKIAWCDPSDGLRVPILNVRKPSEDCEVCGCDVLVEVTP